MLRVAVLMSTYNGEKFIRDQIDSIMKQVGVEVTLYIRDDGSTDRTAELISEVPGVVFTRGENVGVGNSFMQLVYDVPKDYDFYAFADQDDVWLSDKLMAAINKLGTTDELKLYASNQTKVNDTLEVINDRYTSTPDYSYIQTLCGNKIAGCTFVWNNAFHCFIADANRRPSKELLDNRIHDVWFSMIAGAVDGIVYDDESHILYRLHDANVVGVKKTSVIKQWIKKIKDKSLRNGRSRLAGEVLLNFGDFLDQETRDKLEIYGMYRSDKGRKKELLKDKELISHTGESALGFKIKVLFNLV